MPRSRTGLARPLAGALVAVALLAGSGTAALAVERRTPAPSGEAVPVGDLRHWRQVLRQDFTKDARTGRFDAAYPGWSGYDGITDTSRQTARPADQRGLWSNRTTVRVRNGLLECDIHTSGVTPQVCAITPTRTGRWWEGSMYGRYSVRFRADRMPGYKIAWLLWPQGDDWNCGEIDFPEGSLAGTATGAAHRLGAPESTPFFVDTRTRMTAWHTATISWRPGRVTYRLDDRTWSTTNPSVVPTHPMRWALQAESRISAKAPDRAVRGRIQIDWLTEYRWRP